jgi:hypothetical protein
VQKETADKSCQTDKLAEPITVVREVIAAPEPEAEEAPKTFTKRRKTVKLPDAAPWPLANTLKAIQTIYIDKMKADATDDACQNARQNLVEYTEDWFKNQ